MIRAVTRPLTKPLLRRDLLVALPAAGLGLGTVGCRATEARSSKERSEMPGRDAEASLGSSVREVFALGPPPWPTFDPFLFCVHHDDAYPAGNAAMGPAASLEGRRLGSDFAGKDGWRMYHGDVVPGFPRHPHRGFETITVTRRGFIDHSDSLGATARYGGGDVQWMTAGRGIAHAEMFPLLDRHGPNPTELMQIWINLPRRSKFAQPHFSMFWNRSIPDVTVGAQGRGTRVRVVAGRFQGHEAPKPPPDSWASEPRADVAIYTLEMPAGAVLTLPAQARDTERTLYFHRGQSLAVDGRQLMVNVGVRLRGGAKVTLVNGSAASELLLLAGRPIGEPVVRRGPFVMNSAEEIQAAYADYRSTQFGGWPWSGNDPVHPPSKGRFAIHADGRVDRAPT